ncbi:MAG: LptF/LptG family permease [Elusimicrobia bacterium]|nr:LptF/LptG family permease [Elusimicrobiota bacterium]
MADEAGGGAMTIYTRYMVARFIKPFLFGLGLFAVLIFLGDTFDKMNYIVKSKASLGVIFECLWLGVPYWAVRVIPMATLLATLIAMSGFVQSGEWLATQSCGLETRRFWMPVLWASAAIAVVAFAAQETVMPAAWARSQRLWHEKVNPQPEWAMYSDVVFGLDDRLFVQASLFVPKSGRLERPILETMGERGVVSQLDAKTADWDPGARRWVFKSGVERTFGPRGAAEKPFDSVVSPLDSPPAELIPRPLNPDEMTLLQVRDYARRVGRFGGSPREYEVAAQTKIAYPFANIVICALGIPIALRLRRSSRVISFCAALLISFAYLWFMEVGHAMGVGGTLPPWAAGWSANVLFGGTAMYLIHLWDL